MPSWVVASRALNRRLVASNDVTPVVDWGWGRVEGREGARSSRIIPIGLKAFEEYSYYEESQAILLYILYVAKELRTFARDDSAPCWIFFRLLPS
jgi:hypothetical protein